jgi:predicted acylesterase/phospholipase RssA
MRELNQCFRKAVTMLKPSRLTLDHILASSGLPPAFPMTAIGTEHYWDGALFDNTPLGAVLDHLNDGSDVDRTVYVANLFPNTAAIPKNMPEVAARMKNLQFANKSFEDVAAQALQRSDCANAGARIPTKRQSTQGSPGVPGGQRPWLSSGPPYR